MLVHSQVSSDPLKPANIIVGPDDLSLISHDSLIHPAWFLKRDDYGHNQIDTRSETTFAPRASESQRDGPADAIEMEKRWAGDKV